jgi:heme-degrading monooxygenase HmoA
MNAEVFRVDKFVVPAHAREEFLDKVHATHTVLRTQPGFVRDAILEQSSGPGEFNFVTIVEWENSGAIEGARRAVVALHQKMNFDAQAMIRRLGIRADIANYKRVERAMAAE